MSLFMTLSMNFLQINVKIYIYKINKLLFKSIKDYTIKLYISYTII